jgi:hypothetical protein
MSKSYMLGRRINLNEDIVEFMLMECPPNHKKKLDLEGDKFTQTKLKTVLSQEAPYINFRKLKFKRIVKYQFGLAIEYNVK